jgi:hypothetical protein
MLLPALVQAAEDYSCKNWKTDIRVHNALVQTASVWLIDRGLDNATMIELAVSYIEELLDYEEMNRKDQDRVRQATTYLRKIASCWWSFSPIDQLAFRTGKMPPSALAKRAEWRGDDNEPRRYVDMIKDRIALWPAARPSCN